MSERWAPPGGWFAPDFAGGWNLSSSSDPAALAVVDGIGTPYGPQASHCYLAAHDAVYLGDDLTDAGRLEQLAALGLPASWGVLEIPGPGCAPRTVRPARPQPHAEALLADHARLQRRALRLAVSMSYRAYGS